MDTYPDLAIWSINAQGKAPVIIRVNKDGKRMGSASFKHKMPAKHWDKEKKILKEDSKKATYINQLLKNRLNVIENSILKRQVLNQPVTKLIITFLKNGRSFENFTATPIKP